MISEVIVNLTLTFVVAASDNALRSHEQHSLQNQDGNDYIYFLLFIFDFYKFCIYVCVCSSKLVTSLRGYFSSNIEQPQKADARLHEFLDQLDFDIEKAKRLLQGIHCGGKGMSCFLLN